MPEKKNAHRNAAQTETVTVRLEPKLRYLAEIASREHQRTLSSFIECAVRRALSVSAMWEDEPNPGTDPIMKQPLPLWGEGFWDVDEADRFFHLAAARFDLLTINEQRLWKFFGMHQGHIGETINLMAFREFWNHPGINTKHLTADSDGGD